MQTAESFSDIPLKNVPEKGPVPDRRIKNAASLREMFERFYRDDDGNARNRAIIQAMFDGDAPYDEKELANRGQSDLTNVNFGGAETQLEYAMAGYVDLLQSSEDIVSCPTKFGSPEQRFEWEAVINEEITRMIRDWSQFNFNTLFICHQFLMHGIGVGYWPDSSDWRYRGAGLGEFYFPRQTLMSEDDLEVACARRSYPSWHLYSKIKNPESATSLGWNVPAVRKALSQASSQSPQSTDWEALEAEYKNNDLGTSAKHSEVKVVHAWVREFDNSITHYIISNDCLSERGEDEKFLYQNNSKNGSMQQSFVLFAYGLGTNAHIHGVRGLGHKIYPLEQVRNRLYSKSVDGAFLSSSLIIKPNDEDTLSQIALTPFGSHMVLHPNASIENFSMPSFQQAVLPVLNEMDGMLNQRVGSYNTQSAFGGERKTRFEVAARLEEATRLSSTSLQFFYAPFERLMREVVRRIVRKNYITVEPGGPEVAKLRRRILERGVPLEAFYNIDIDAVRVVRTLGGGSPTARAMALAQLEEMAPGYDDTGRYNLRRDRTVATVGVAQADRYVPRKPGGRTPPSVRIAMLENNDLMSGEEVEILPDDDHIIHAEVHAGKIQQVLAQAEEQALPIEEVAPRLMPIYNHSAQHLDMVSGDASVVSRAAGLRQILQQAGEIISNGVKKLQAMERKAAEEAQAQAEAGNQQIPAEAAQPQQSVEDIIKFERHRADIQQQQEKHELSMNLKIQEATMKRQIEEIKAASAINRLA